MYAHDEKILSLVGNITVAIPDSRVQRILSSDDSLYLLNAGALSAIAAIDNGISYPLYDARNAVGLPERNPTQSREILVIHDSLHPKIGIVVDRVLCTMVCDSSMHSSADLVKLPAYLLILNACTYRNRMVLLLDIDAIMRMYAVAITAGDHFHLEAG